MTEKELARKIDLTAVRADTTEADVRELAGLALDCRCAAVYTHPCFTPLALKLLTGADDVRVGGSIGFPSGAHSTATKVAEARELMDMGCTELDMVISLGMFLSGEDGPVEEEIRRIKAVAGRWKLKVILECHYLSDDQIRRASLLCVRAGADFIKTSTGWAPGGATPHNVSVIRSAVGGAPVAIKAAGGIRSLTTVEQLAAEGATRFGVGYAAARTIFSQCGLTSAR
jgi:deoxyribose-phosphate aldolase